MKVYVGNLPFSVDDEKLKELFSSYGEIEEVSVIKDKFSGRSKGFGFVTFKNDDEAKKAIEEMNDKEVEGRALKVNEAKPLDPDAPRKPRRNFGGRRRDSRGPRRDFGNSDGNRRRF
ncbi:MAG TPA: RNA-binding protein [Candidatus Pacearchaeota archaeon]|jgi:RNA recognition motif-containing protein|nr:RNA-binding protein [Candidatus Pacearchaeota archaeon]HOR52524.1 RNA-binding protein [Candidatus Pacearchaeota archaeon]HOU79155.1 RNA-binding protein [Candidatus Pacearchaeota archaeon]HPJ86907.1 RNA-binding protein [Candidatus Pacearchaeota archaeon]HPX74304.1 RNA-binding protein [Candidatus Pacearchaeota archaeon]